MATTRCSTTTFEEFLKRAREAHGTFYQYNKDTYTSLPKNILITCPTHGEFSQRAGRHLTGTGCPICARSLIAKSKTFSSEEFLDKAKAVWGDRYTYDKTIYTGVRNPVIITCKNHGDFTRKANDFLRQRSHCPQCQKKEQLKYTTESYISLCKTTHDNKYSYDKTVFTGINEKLIVTCETHGDFSVRASNHLHTKVGCRKCTQDRNTVDDFLIAAYRAHGDKYDYSKCVYTRNTEYGIFICPSHGEFKQTFMSHLQGKSCPKCKVVTSNPQKELTAFIKSIYKGKIETNHKLLGKKEVDVYLPELNLAVELDGAFWHSTAGPNYQKLPVHKRRNTALKNQTYKHTALQEQGIRLITIFDLEWERKKEAVKNILLHALHAFPKIGARKCELRTIAPLDCKTFLNTYHIQGATPAQIYYGLYYQEELVSVMSFRKTKDEWELARYCSIYSVQGGASKLLSAFLTYHKPPTIVSFCHGRLFNGDVYKALGFTLSKSYPFDYYFFYLGKIYTRRHFTKVKIPAEFHLKGYFETTENYGAYTLFVPGGSKYLYASKTLRVQ